MRLVSSRVLSVFALVAVLQPAASSAATVVLPGIDTASPRKPLGSDTSDDSRLRAYPTVDGQVKFATTIAVSSAAELIGALSSAKGGETILLQGGNYGALSLYDARDAFAKFSEVVTIKSADAKNKATFSSLYLRGAKNLVLDSLKFDYVSASAAPEWVRPFQIVGNSQNISIVNSVFDGDLARGVSDVANGLGTGIGLGVSGATNITVENNKFFNWHRAGVFGGVGNLSVNNNEVYHIRSDGFNFAQVNFVSIEGNYLHDFITSPASGDHMDMIQFWTTGTTSPSTNIVIRDNILDSGGGNLTQSIFMRNELVDQGLAGDEMFYRNIVIENNVIHNAHTHGITVGETHGLIIQNNTILHNLGSGGAGSVYVPTINLKTTSTDVEVKNNIVPRLSLQSSGNATIENNLIVQLDPLADGSATLADLMGVPNGIIDQMGVGSSLTRFPTKSDDVTPVPLPAALPLFGSALAAMGIFRWWRRRTAAAA